MKFPLDGKKYPTAIRINSALPSKNAVKIKGGEIVEYTLLSIPFYLIGQIHRLLNVLSQK